MDELSVVFSESELKIIEVDGQRWISAIDVARALDYKNPSVAVSEFISNNAEILESCLRKFRRQYDSGSKENWFFNSRGLMAFLVKSNRQKAIPFQKWAIEVLDNEIKKKFAERDENYKTARLKSKRVRVQFTDTLKAHGYEAPKDYIMTTYMMKTRLGIEKHRPKNDLDIWELCQISMVETLSTYRLSESSANSVSESVPIIANATSDVAKIPK